MRQLLNFSLKKKFAAQGIGVVAIQEFKEDKYTYTDMVEINCVNRISICHAACCKFDLALSKQDIEEGIVKWELGRPYMIARDDDEYCRHLDRCTYQCDVWEHRPIPCRGYDCRNDERIWIDFEKAVLNPHLDDLLQKRSEMAD